VARRVALFIAYTPKRGIVINKVKQKFAQIYFLSPTRQNAALLPIFNSIRCSRKLANLLFIAYTPKKRGVVINKV
jgi:hypothetical protein